VAHPCKNHSTPNNLYLCVWWQVKKLVGTVTDMTEGDAESWHRSLQLAMPGMAALPLQWAYNCCTVEFEDCEVRMVVQTRRVDEICL